MSNETSNNTAANDTAGDTNMTNDILATVEEIGFLEEPMVLALLACVGALVAFVGYTNPTLKAARPFLARLHPQTASSMPSLM